MIVTQVKKSPQPHECVAKTQKKRKLCRAGPPTRGTFDGSHHLDSRRYTGEEDQQEGDATQEYRAQGYKAPYDREAQTREARWRTSQDCAQDHTSREYRSSRRTQDREAQDGCTSQDREAQDGCTSQDCAQGHTSRGHRSSQGPGASQEGRREVGQDLIGAPGTNFRKPKWALKVRPGAPIFTVPGNRLWR